MGDQHPNQTGPPRQSGFHMGVQNVPRTQVQQASGFQLGPQVSAQNAQSNLQGSGRQSTHGFNVQQQAAPSTEPIPDAQLRAYSKLIGRSWELTAVGLGYTQHQVDCLKENYHHKTETLLYMMVKKWHDVVVRCGEDARKLLAACFASEDNNEAAEQVIGPGNLAGLQGGAGIGAARTTEAAIRQISFDLQTSTASGATSALPAIVNVGGDGGFNVFPGSDVSFGEGGTISIGSGSSNSNIPSGLANITYLSADMMSGRERNIGGQHATNVFGSKYTAGPRTQLRIGDVPQQQACSNEPVRGEIADVTDSAAKLKLSSTGSEGPMSSTAHELKKDICDMLSQSQVNGLAEVMKSVCAVVGPDSYGTGFRVGEKFLITAYHVIRDIVQKGQTLSAEVYITFNESLIYNPTNTKVYHITDEYQFDEKLDIAFLIIADPDDRLPKPLALSLADKFVSNISLIGYGHPEGTEKKHLDPGCPVISQQSQIIHDAHAWLGTHSVELKNWYISANKDPGVVDQGFCGYDSSFNMIINCYSEKGASGGPLVDCRNPNSMAVVGVLTHGLPVCFWELPKHIQEKFPTKFRLEVATRMTSIKDLASKIDADFSQHLFP